MAVEPFDLDEPLLTPSKELANFTNRILEQASLHRILDTPRSENSTMPMLHFYGVGGTGKTWLLRKLQGITKAVELPTAYLNLEELTSGPMAMVTAIASIRDQLSVFEMPRFDVAMGWYLQKIGFAKEKPAKFGAKQGGLAVDALDALAGVPFLGKALKGIGKLLEGTSIERWLDSITGQQFYNQMKGLTADQIRHELPKLFLRDLAKSPYPNSVPDHRRNFQARAVLFLDTFESLRKGEDRTSDPIHDRESWVNGLHNPKAPLLVVSAGRDTIRWGEREPAYLSKENLEQHLVGGLSHKDAVEFLIKCGIEQPKLVEAVLAVSHDEETIGKDGEPGFHPFTLGLCADTIDVARRNNKVIDPDTFNLDPRDTARLAERFLKSLHSDAQEAWIRSLALTPRFDESAARAAYSGVHSVDQDAAWTGLLRYSFVRPSDEAGWFTFHSKLCDALAKTLTAKRDLHGKWAEYWRLRSTNDVDDAAGLAWYHRFSINPTMGHNEWYALAESYRGAALRMAEHYAILNWWEPVHLFYRKSEGHATALNNLGNEFINATLGDRGINLTTAIRCYEAALVVRTKEQFPQDWAATQNNMGNAYAGLPTGDRSVNLTTAIKCYKSALEVRTKKQFPHEWAMTQSNLGAAYLHMPTGDRVLNLTTAIRCNESVLEVRTKERFPWDWATNQNNLGVAYQELPTGDRSVNLATAIRCYNAALEVRTKERFPQDWASTQNNLGAAYLQLLTGDLSVNLANAIRCLESALEVRIKERFPWDWATTQNNLGNAFFHLPTGDRGANLATAIRYYDASLEIRTKEQFPQDWAATQNNLGNVYLHHPTGDRGVNLATAIRFYAAAQEVYTKERFPQEWAMTQNHLGEAYRNLPTGDRGEHLAHAVRRFEGALEIYSQEFFTKIWATTHGYLALCHEAWSHIADRQTHRDLALRHMQKAGEGFRLCGDSYGLYWHQTSLDNWRSEWSAE